MKLSNLIIIVLLSLEFYSCGNDCGKNDKLPRVQCSGNPIANEYIGVFEDGNWWVYENNAGTLRDSIYLKLGIDRYEKDMFGEPCEDAHVRSYPIRSKLYHDKDYIYKIEKDGNCSRKYIEFGISYWGLLTTLSNFQNVDDGYNSFVFENGIFQETKTSIIDSTVVHSIIIPKIKFNNIEYQNVIELFHNPKYKVWIAKNKGIVAYKNKTDTLFAVKSNIF